jgi:hypothetical protein
MEIGDTKTKSRIELLDIVKGISMFFIIASHSGYAPLYFKIFYNSFFLVSYFIISGYLFHNPDKGILSLGKKTTRIIESILVPYLVYWILSYSVGAIIKGNYNFIPGLLVDILHGNKLWFMSSLIVSEIIFAFYLSVFQKPLAIIIFIFLNFGLWFIFKDYKLVWSIELSFMASIFIAFGHFLRIYNDIFIKYLNDKKVGIGIVVLWGILFGIQCFLGFDMSFPANRLGSIVLYIPYVLAGSFAVFYLGTKWKKHTKLVLFLGQNSLLYYFFQHQVLNVVLYILRKAGFTNENYFSPMIVALLVSLILIIPIMLVKKYFPIMAGKVVFLSNYIKK